MAMTCSKVVKAVMVLLVFCSAPLRAQMTAPSSWIGVWNGTLEGQPGVTLTLADDHGQLGGTVVFNFIVGPPPSTRIGGSDTLLVTHPRLEGNTFSFQVNRTSDKKLLQFAVRSIDSDRLEMRCVNCGDSPNTTLVRYRP
jgi:hypothetical protein